MTYADNYNIRATSVKFNDVANAIDGLITRNYIGITTGTSTAYIATPTPAWDAYTTSGIIVIIPHAANTGAATINVSNLGTRDLRIGNAPIAAGVIQQNIPTLLAYTGTYFEVLLQNISIPIGTIYSYAGATAPVGYLLCDGSSQSTTGPYAALYNVIGYTYGGSGATFLLPDLRRRVPIGKGASDALGDNDLVAYASRSTNQSLSVPAHYHTVGSGSSLSAAGQSFTGSSSTTTIGSTGSGHGHGVGTLATTTSGSAHSHSLSVDGGATGANQDRLNRSGVTTSQGTAQTGNPYNTLDGAHTHGVSGTIGGSDGTHSHTGVTISIDHTHAASAVTGTIGNFTSTINGDSAMTSGAGQYLYINYIIKV